jgi:hypothetical protein
MPNRPQSGRCSSLYPTALAYVLSVAPVPATPVHAEGTQQAEPPAQGAMATKHSPYHPRGVPPRATMFYQTAWGIDKLLVRRTASGALVRFSYRVTDAERAKPLGEKEATPHLIDWKRGVALQIPVMENVGQLRQTGTPVVGKEYWMVFSNKGDMVKAGDRVDVVIGSFHAEGLLLE